MKDFDNGVASVLQANPRPKCLVHLGKGYTATFTLETQLMRRKYSLFSRRRKSFLSQNDFLFFRYSPTKQY